MTRYQESLESFKNIIKTSLPVSVSILDRKHALIFSNDATLDLLGKPSSDIDLDKEMSLFIESHNENDYDGEKVSLDSILTKAFLRQRVKALESPRFSHHRGFLKNINLEDGKPKPIDVLIGVEEKFNYLSE